jgi:hypothetical protein
MAQIRKLEPHDPLPTGGRNVVLLRRFEEDDPRRIVLELVISRGGGREETRQALHADGRPMSVSEALQSARTLADAEKLDPIYIIDRLAGPRERDILRHHGDHSVHMGQLDDFDLEEGERGSDMRDRHP